MLTKICLDHRPALKSSFKSLAWKEKKCLQYSSPLRCSSWEAHKVDEHIVVLALFKNEKLGHLLEILPRLEGWEYDLKLPY